MAFAVVGFAVWRVEDGLNQQQAGIASAVASEIDGGSGTARWNAFVARQDGMACSLGAVNVSDLTGSYAQIVVAQSCFQVEFTWLAANPPEACYQSVWQAFNDFYGEVGLGLSALEAVALNPSDSGDLNTGSARLSQAASTLRQANSLMSAGVGDSGFCQG